MHPTSTITPITSAATRLGSAPLNEASLREHIWPLFSRVLKHGPREIYLANHSLGRPLDQTAHDVQEALDIWYASLDGAWDAWLAEIQRFRAGIAQLIGAGAPDSIVPKTAAGQGLRAVLNALVPPTPRVLATSGEFDSMDFILRTYHHKQRANVRWVATRTPADPQQPPIIDPADIIAAINDYRPHLVLISHVYFTTGQVLDRLNDIISAAHHAQSLVMLDTYHSAGVIPIHFDQLNADFAVGGSYKYTRGGPGACWLAINPRHLPTTNSPEREGKLRTLDTGWFAKLDTFKYQRPDEPLLSSGGDAWLESTPAILPFYQARAGLALTLALGINRLRTYSLEQQAFLANQLDKHGINVIAPQSKNQSSRGAFLLMPRNDAQQFCARLLLSGVNADSRQGFVRFCPDILTSMEAMTQAAALIARAANQ